MSDRANYLNILEHKVRFYMGILEDMFGPRDPRFLFGSIKKSDDDSPQLNYPNKFHLSGGCLVDIWIGEWPYENQCQDQGSWQVAHECVHLLDPVKYGTANVLEEGLATWFQDEKEFHDDVVRAYIECAEQRNDAHAPNYLHARNLVRRCMTQHQFAPIVKELRSLGVRISEISVAHLEPYKKSHLSTVDAASLTLLCEKFQY